LNGIAVFDPMSKPYTAMIEIAEKRLRERKRPY